MWRARTGKAIHGCHGGPLLNVTRVGTGDTSRDRTRPRAEGPTSLHTRTEIRHDRFDRAVPADPSVFTTTGATTTTTTTEPPTTTTTAPPQPVEVARFSGGSTGTETQDFTVDGTWELQYSASGGAGLIVELIDSATGNRVDNISPDAGSGTSSFRQGGTYYLKVQTFGTDSWELVVVDVP